MFHYYQKIVRSFPGASQCFSRGWTACCGFLAELGAAAGAADPARRRAQDGSVILLVAVAATALILCLVLALDAGRLYLARTQLQIAADNAARAALLAVYDPNAPKPLVARNTALTAAQLVVAGNSVVDGGAELKDEDMVFGDYDFDADQFKEAGPGAPARPSAVRIDLKRTAERGSPIRGLLVPMGVTASAVASLRCRQVALAIDLSASFEEEIGDARDALRSTLSTFKLGASRGDALALVSFSGAGTDHAKKAWNLEKELKKVAGGDASDFEQAIGGLNTCPRKIGAPCLGTNTGAGLRIAREQLDSPAAEECNGDRLIVLITDGVPCDLASVAATNRLIADAVEQVDLAASAKISVSTIFLYDAAGTNQFNSCANNQNGARSDADFTASLARGDIGRAYDNSKSESLKQLLAVALGSFPVAIVH